MSQCWSPGVDHRLVLPAAFSGPGRQDQLRSVGNGARLSYQMQTKVSTKGHVVLPGSLRRRLGIRAGDQLEVNIVAGRIVLTPRKKRPHRVKIVRDPITGLPAFTAGSGAPPLTSKEVDEILATFP